jgi:hypothetical protein
MVLAPNDLFSWNNKYNKYNKYTVTDTFTCFFLSYAHQLTQCMLASQSHEGVIILGLLSSSHVFSLPLSGLNWRSLTPPWGSGPPFPNMAAPFTGSAHTPLPGSGTLSFYSLPFQLIELPLSFLSASWASTFYIFSFHSLKYFLSFRFFSLQSPPLHLPFPSPSWPSTFFPSNCLSVYSLHFQFTGVDYFTFQIT